MLRRNFHRIVGDHNFHPHVRCVMKQPLFIIPHPVLTQLPLLMGFDSDGMVLPNSLLNFKCPHQLTQHGGLDL